jgi:hypothetical protein
MLLTNMGMEVVAERQRERLIEAGQQRFVAASTASPRLLQCCLLSVASWIRRPLVIASSPVDVRHLAPRGFSATS